MEFAKNKENFLEGFEENVSLRLFFLTYARTGK